MKSLILLTAMFWGIAMPVSLYYSTTLGILFCLVFGIFSFTVSSLAGLLIVRIIEE